MHAGETMHCQPCYNEQPDKISNCAKLKKLHCESKNAEITNYAIMCIFNEVN